MEHAANAAQRYREGVDALCEGRAEEACRLLEAVPAEARPRGWELALGRSYLDAGRGEDAARCFEGLLASPPSDPGAHAHLVLLSAAAMALTGALDEARSRLGGVAAIDPRLERAARALRKRIDEDARPDPRL
jgi:tetratricopeptide (TPR) repeat protein